MDNFANFSCREFHLSRKSFKWTYLGWKPDNITKTSLFKYTENFTTKKWKFSDKLFDTFFIFLLKNINVNEYPQSMFLSRNKKNNVYPCKPQFYYIKVVFKGVNFI